MYLPVLHLVTREREEVMQEGTERKKKRLICGTFQYNALLKQK